MRTVLSIKAFKELSKSSRREREVSKISLERKKDKYYYNVKTFKLFTTGKLAPSAHIIIDY